MANIDKDMAVMVTPGPQQLAMLSPQAVADRSKAIHEIMAKAMRDKVDYGMVPGCGDKPTLLKAGAEKLLMTFQLAPKVTVLDLSTVDAIRYRVTVSLYTQAGLYLGDGVGEASTAEDKYAWRRAVSKAEWDNAPEMARRVKYVKDYTINQVRTNPPDQANTVLKMGKKRALVDAVLTVLGASDIFTQDIEDMEAGIDKTTGEVIPPAKDVPAAHTGERATAKQTSFIQRNFTAVGLDQEDLWTLINKIAPEAKKLTDLSYDEAMRVITELRALHESQVEAAKKEEQS